MARKTVPVTRVVHLANKMLENTSTVDKQLRLGICALVESVLFETDNYKGFSYLQSEFKPVDEQLQGESPLRENYDDTRRRYF